MISQRDRLRSKSNNKQEGRLMMVEVDGEGKEEGKKITEAQGFNYLARPALIARHGYAPAALTPRTGAPSSRVFGDSRDRNRIRNMTRTNIPDGRKKDPNSCKALNGRDM